MEGLQKETLELIQKTAQDAVGSTGKVQVISLPDKLQPKYLIISPDGEYVEVDGDIPQHEFRLNTLKSIIPFIDELVAREGDLVSPVIWYNESNVVVDFDVRLKMQSSNYALCNLRLTDECEALKKLAVAAPLSQKAMINLLRIDFIDCMDADGHQLISALRAVDFRNETSASSTIENGRESLGRDIQAEVKSKAGDIPEEITLHVRLFDDPLLTTPERYSLYF